MIPFGSISKPLSPLTWLLFVSVIMFLCSDSKHRHPWPKSKSFICWQRNPEPALLMHPKKTVHQLVHLYWTCVFRRFSLPPLGSLIKCREQPQPLLVCIQQRASWFSQHERLTLQTCGDLCFEKYCLYLRNCSLRGNDESRGHGCRLKGYIWCFLSSRSDSLLSSQLIIT